MVGVFLFYKGCKLDNGKSKRLFGQFTQDQTPGPWLFFLQILW